MQSVHDGSTIRRSTSISLTLSQAGEEVPFTWRLSCFIANEANLLVKRHAWLSYMVDTPPNQDKILETGVRKWEPPEHRPNFTLTRAAYKTYST